MGRDDTFAYQIREKCPVGLDRIKCEIITKELASGKQEVPEDPSRRRRYRRETSREKIKAEDEAVLDFLTHSRRRRGFIGRNPSVKAAAEPLNRLEQMLNKNLEKRRGRPISLKYKRDNQKFSLYLNPEFVKHLEDYSQKNGHLSMQDAVRWILREYLRYSGYPVGLALEK